MSAFTQLRRASAYGMERAVRSVPGGSDVVDRVRDRLPYGLTPRRTDVDHGLARMPSELTFAQLGSNDGLTSDAIHRFVAWRRWTGIAVEAAPRPFARLQQTYRRNRRVVPINAAVGNETGSATFYYVDPEPGDTLEADKLGSFSRGHLMNHASGIPRMNERIRTMQVPVFTFADLCAKGGLTTVDLVHLDVEGLDYEILMQLPLEAFRVRAVLFEHVHMTGAQFDEARGRLEKAQLVEVGRSPMDTLYADPAFLT